MSKTQTQQNGWREVTVQDLTEEGFCVIKNNLRKPISSTQRSKMQGKYPYYGAAGQIDSVNDYRVEGYHLLVAEDGTVTSNGINPMLQLVDGKFWVSNHAHIMQGKTKQETLLLYYMLSAVDINTYITGAVQPKLSKTNLLKITLNLPPLPEQKAIAEVLSSLDEKIDLLHRQNKTLEDMAQALFRKWFIEEAKKDWEEKPLDEIADYLNGLACQKYPPENEIDKLPVLKIKELRNGFTENSDWATSKVDEKYIIELGDVIFSWSGSLMLKIWDGQKCVLNQHLFKVTSENYPKWFYYFWTKHHLEKFIGIANSKATTMGHIKRGDLSNSLVMVPNTEELLKMSERISPEFEKIILNCKQIANLEQQRDTLLPKLMTGAVRVKLN
jgi:type I restriction enzyme S subunit